MSETKEIRCLSCGAVNRVKTATRQQPLCGRCKAPLSGLTQPVTITDGNFAELVDAAPLPVLVDFWAAWCGPCRMLAPVIEDIASELAGKVQVGKLNIDENPRTAARFDVRSIPTMVIFQHGREMQRIVGLQGKAEIMRALARFV